jgi:hypothetical protein
MTCSNPSFSQKVESATATYSLNGDYSASLTVVDVNQDIEVTPRLRVYHQFDLDINSAFCSGEYSPTVEGYFSGSFKMVDGILSGISVDAAPESSIVTMTFESKFEWLKSKSVNTEPFVGIAADSVFDAVAVVYGGTFSSFITNNTSPVLISGPAIGNNLYDELKLIAQAGYSHLVVQTDGQLSTEPWYEVGRALDYEIPCSAVISYSKVLNTNRPPSILKVRGNTQGYYACGEQDFSDLKTSSDSDVSGYESLGGGAKKCLRIGVAQKDAEVVNYNLTGKKEDLLNARVDITGMSLREVKAINDGTLTSVITDGDFIQKGSVSFYTSITGNRKPDTEVETKVDNLRATTVPPYEFITSIGDRLMKRAPSRLGQGFGSGVSGGIGHVSPTLTNREISDKQIEVSVYWPAAISAWGVVEEQMENKYVICKEHLCKLAVQRFRQWIMEQNTYEVEVVPIPGIKLNDYVTIDLPKQRFTDVIASLEGIISGVSVDWNAETSQTTMKLSVMSVAELGNETFLSSNLINGFCGINGDGEWAGTGTSPSEVGNVNGETLVLLTVGAGYAYVQMDQPCMTVGETYTITFDAEFAFGTSPYLSFSVPGTGLTVAIPATGSYSYNFVAVGNTHTLLWEVASTESNYWKVRNIILTRTFNG